MSVPERCISRYTRGLEAYLREPDEAALERAYELGREAIASGAGLLELVQLHVSALERLLPALQEHFELTSLARGAGRFLTEALSPLEMALRGFREANEALQRLNQGLEKRVEERTHALADAQHMYRRLVEEVPAMIYTLAPAERAVLYVSPQVSSLTGFTPDEWSHDLWLQRILPEDEERVADARRRALDLGEPIRVEYRLEARDGSIRWLRDEAAPAERAGHETVLRGIALDITEARRLEEQFRQAQRLESVGRLAGGVAHDFNNLLSVILTNASLAQDALEHGEPAQEELTDIQEAARRATGLTRQLLAFSRRQVLEARPVSVSELVGGMERMFRRLIGAHIALEVELPSPDLFVTVDPGQLEQVLMNLVVNARDAVDAGGRIHICASRVERSAGERSPPGASPGAYVRIAVSDDGPGIPADVLAHIFEPFFTTKSEGRGTGLGLATCLGIVQQSGGFIDVVTAPGRGSAFEVYLPPSAPPAGMAPPAAAEDRRAPGRATVLLVEDDPALRRATTRLLERAGHRVLAASQGREALALFETRVGRIDVVLSDLVMPQMDGRSLAKEIRARDPGVRIVLMTGYAEDGGPQADRDAAGLETLHKPIAEDTLLGCVQDVLRGAAASPVDDEDR